MKKIAIILIISVISIAACKKPATNAPTNETKHCWDCLVSKPIYSNPGLTASEVKDTTICDKTQTEITQIKNNSSGEISNCEEQ